MEWRPFGSERGQCRCKLSPNPPIDGVRTAEGGEGATGEMAWAHWDRLEVGGRSSVAGQGPYGRLRELRCAGCERIRSRELPQTGVVRVFGDVGSVAGRPSGREWNGSQPGQGAIELGFPRPALGKMQGKPESTDGRPWGQPLKQPEGAPLNLG